MIANPAPIQAFFGMEEVLLGHGGLFGLGE
jgi:hypothetical protein